MPTIARWLKQNHIASLKPHPSRPPLDCMKNGRSHTPYVPLPRRGRRNGAESATVSIRHRGVAAPEPVGEAGDLMAGADLGEPDVCCDLCNSNLMIRVQIGVQKCDSQLPQPCITSAAKDCNPHRVVIKGTNALPSAFNRSGTSATSEYNNSGHAQFPTRTDPVASGSDFSRSRNRR
jgi:hypothetical protein